jgi:hypothetical protein
MQSSDPTSYVLIMDDGLKTKNELILGGVDEVDLLVKCMHHRIVL